MKNIIFTEEELYSIARGTRICTNILMKEPTPYSCSIEEDLYWKYISKYKSEIIRFLPINYLCMKHKHRDTYIHFSSLENLYKIMDDGVLKKNKSNDICTLGSAIYTYPLRSGMYFYNHNLKDKGFLVFDAEETHYHIVQTDDTPTCIGEADFLCDELKIENSRILTLNEISQMSEKFFDWDYAKKNYFGLDCKESATYKSMYDTIEYYNYNYK